jgi:hypothetical protein
MEQFIGLIGKQPLGCDGGATVDMVQCTEVRNGD